MCNSMANFSQLEEFCIWCKCTAWQKQKQNLSAWEGWTCNENDRNSRGNLPRLISLLMLLFKHLLEQKPDPFFNGCLDTFTGTSPLNCQAPGFPGSLVLLWLAQKHIDEAPGSQPLQWHLPDCPGKRLRLPMLSLKLAEGRQAACSGKD